ncbi:MAG: hypothetical protein RLN89_09960 [Parvibaculum sp.]
MSGFRSILFGVMFLFSTVSVQAEPVANLPADASAQYEQVRVCTNNAKDANQTEGLNWWNRRTPQQQRYMLELPCEEKYIVTICVFLYDPDLKGCTNKGVARYRADRHCAAQGFEILSEEKAACEKEYVANFKPVF